MKTSTGTLAERMLSDYDRKQPGTVFGEGLRLSLDDAWELQEAVAELRMARGEQPAGYKIGCVCQTNQRSNGLTHPVWGHLWEGEQYASGVELFYEDYANVGIEAEFGIVLGADLPAEPSESDLLACIDRVVPVIELHNVVMRGAAPRGHELIANNAIHAGVVRGEGLALDAIDVDRTDLSYTYDGEQVDRWSDLRWPTDLLQAVGWLAEQLGRRQRHLRAGETILTGAWGPPVPLAAHTHIAVQSSAFGGVEAYFKRREGTG